MESREDWNSFIPETPIKHLLCVSHQTRLNSGNLSLEEVVLFQSQRSYHDHTTGLFAFYQGDIAFNRWNFLPL